MYRVHIYTHVENKRIIEFTISRIVSERVSDEERENRRSERENELQRLYKRICISCIE